MTTPRVGDDELLERWRAGDKQAGNKLVSRHIDRVSGFFRNAVGDRECLDLTQETFTRLVQSIERFEGRGSFRAYLFGIARRVLHGHYRDNYREGIFDPLTHTVEDVAGVNPSNIVTQVLEHSALLDCLRHLSIDQKQLLECYYWHDMTAAELAVVFDIPEPTVRTRAHAARQSLRRCLERRSIQLSDLDFEAQIKALATLLRVGITGLADSEQG